MIPFLPFQVSIFQELHLKGIHIKGYNRISISLRECNRYEGAMQLCAIELVYRQV